MPDGTTSTASLTSRSLETHRTLAEAGSLLPARAAGLVYAAGGKRLIDGIDLTLGAGTTTVVMGPNGAGKSLLLRLLHGLLRPTSGMVSWNGRAPDDVVRRRQAMVFQRPVLLRRSAGANIDFVLGLGGKACPERRRKLLAQVGLEQHEASPARALSGGEQQRLALARALALEPAVLFLDEATANLDPASAQAIETIVETVSAQGIKVVLVTHDIAQARRLAGDVVFMHRGRVLEHGPAGAFFAGPRTTEGEAFLRGRIVI